MRNTIQIVILLYLSINTIQAQDIVNKLGGTTDNEVYKVTDSNDLAKFSVTAAGNITINGNIALEKKFYDSNISSGQSGQFLSSTGNWTEWKNPTDVQIISSYPATLSAGDRILSTYPPSTPQPVLNFTIPTAVTSLGKTINIFVSRTDLVPSLHFSQPVIVGDGSAYSGDSYLEVTNLFEGVVTLVSDGSNWRGFGVVYGGEICFIAGTKITMADGSLKNIEDIQVGEIIASYNFDSNAIVNKCVLKTFANPPSTGLVEITFSNDVKNINTTDHRYYVKDKGWSAVNATGCEDRSVIVEELVIGDICLFNNGNTINEVTVINITELPQLEVSTYNFNVDDSECYYANGILVHNRY